MAKLRLLVARLRFYIGWYGKPIADRAWDGIMRSVKRPVRRALFLLLPRRRADAAGADDGGPLPKRPPQRILVMLAGGLGDLVLAQGCCRALAQAYPGVKIHVTGNPAVRSILPQLQHLRSSNQITNVAGPFAA